MDITMHSIKAGPDGCADAGETIRVTQEEGERLIDQKFATRATPRFPRRETTMVDPQEAEQRAREEAAQRQKEKETKEAAAKSLETIQAALAQLDPDEDDDWTGGGKPAMDRVKGLTGSETLLRHDLDAMFPDFLRPKVSSEAPAKPGASPNSGARSNKP